MSTHTCPEAASQVSNPSKPLTTLHNACLSEVAMFLICRTLQDFKTTGVSDEIANMRLQYHEDKRRAYTLQVEDAIRHGVIEEVKNEFPQGKQATAMHRTTGSMGRT